MVIIVARIQINNQQWNNPLQITKRSHSSSNHDNQRVGWSNSNGRWCQKFSRQLLTKQYNSDNMFDQPKTSSSNNRILGLQTWDICKPSSRRHSSTRASEEHYQKMENSKNFKGRTQAVAAWSRTPRRSTRNWKIIFNAKNLMGLPSRVSRAVARWGRNSTVKFNLIFRACRP